LVKGIEGVRVPGTAQLGPRMLERFSVDLVIGAQITATPEAAHPLDLLGDLPGLVRPDYRLYPLVDTAGGQGPGHHGATRRTSVDPIP
jgi:hypothetical protein